MVQPFCGRAEFSNASKAVVDGGGEVVCPAPFLRDVLLAFKRGGSVAMIRLLA